jgi:hypothetical protein
MVDSPPTSSPARNSDTFTAAGRHEHPTRPAYQRPRTPGQLPNRR